MRRDKIDVYECTILVRFVKQDRGPSLVTNKQSQGYSSYYRRYTTAISAVNNIPSSASDFI